VRASRSLPFPVGLGLARHVVGRNMTAFRRAWLLLLSGFVEPVFYLFSIGVGVGQMIDGFTFNGRFVDYAAFVAPGMLAASAMNGAILDSTFGIFFKLRYDKVYEGVLATPMRTIDIARGELAWSLMRSAVYAAGFVVVMAAMGLVSSWWAVLAWPATWLIGFAFAGTGMALTTFMKSWQDFEYIQLAIMPMATTPMANPIGANVRGFTPPRKSMQLTAKATTSPEPRSGSFAIRSTESPTTNR